MVHGQGLIAASAVVVATESLQPTAVLGLTGATPLPQQPAAGWPKPAPLPLFGTSSVARFLLQGQLRVLASFWRLLAVSPLVGENWLTRRLSLCLCQDAASALQGSELGGPCPQTCTFLPATVSEVSTGAPPSAWAETSWGWRSSVSSKQVQLWRRVSTLASDR